MGRPWRPGGSAVARSEFDQCLLRSRGAVAAGSSRGRRSPRFRSLGTARRVHSRAAHRGRRCRSRGVRLLGDRRSLARRVPRRQRGRRPTARTPRGCAARWRFHGCLGDGRDWDAGHVRARPVDRLDARERAQLSRLGDRGPRTGGDDRWRTDPRCSRPTYARCSSRSMVRSASPHRPRRWPTRSWHSSIEMSSLPPGASGVPTLLIAGGQPLEGRATRERAWRRFADSSTLIELHVADAWGHNAILQDSQASSRLIADWLERHR